MKLITIQTSSSFSLQSTGAKLFMPDVFSQLSAINLAVTPLDLVEQILIDVVKLEKL